MRLFKPAQMGKATALLIAQPGTRANPAAGAVAPVGLANEGLRPSAEARRVLFADGTTIVVEGPFPATAELLAGFWLWQVRSMDEAVAWARRCPDPMPGAKAVLELRRIRGAEAFGRPSQP